MKRTSRNKDGYYHINNKKYKILIGSRRQVWNENAYKTSGKLTKNDLMFNNKTKRIISKKKHITAKKEMRLEKYGYYAQKGKFGYVRRTPRRSSRKSSRRSSQRS